MRVAAGSTRFPFVIGPRSTPRSARHLEKSERANYLLRCSQLVRAKPDPLEPEVLQMNRSSKSQYHKQNCSQRRRVTVSERHLQAYLLARETLRRIGRTSVLLGAARCGPSLDDSTH